MNYQISVPKIHCMGCVNLIKISLEEIFENVSVDMILKTAKFTSKNNVEQVRTDLENVFTELESAGYQYLDLLQTN